VRELAIIPDQLLSGVRDMSAQGGEEIESGTGDRAWRIGAGATIVILGAIGNPARLAIIAQSIQTDGRVNHVSGRAFSRFMVLARHGIPLKYRKPRMLP
jgi:hypothetical protein